MNDQCKHVRSGKRKVFASTRATGEDAEGNALSAGVDVCERCFGPFLWELFGKLPEGATLRLSKAGGDLAMKWEMA